MFQINVRCQLEAFKIGCNFITAHTKEIQRSINKNKTRTIQWSMCIKNPYLYSNTVLTTVFYFDRRNWAYFRFQLGRFLILTMLYTYVCPFSVHLPALVPCPVAHMPDRVGVHEALSYYSEKRSLSFLVVSPRVLSGAAAGRLAQLRANLSSSFSLQLFSNARSSRYSSSSTGEVESL